MGSKKSKSVLPNPWFNPCERQLLIVPGNLNWTNWTLKWWEGFNSMTGKRSFALLLGIKQEACWPIAVVSSVQSLNRVQLFVTPWTAARQTSLSIANSWSLPKPMSIESVMPSNHLILCRPLLLLPSIFPSIRVFLNESALRMRWPKYWSFSFNISPSSEHPGLISFRMDWLDLLAVQGTLKSLLQRHSSKASILQHSAFFIVQFSHHTWPLEKP